MIHIANPIYDSVFKYLMEDERVARTILSALLKKEVVSVEMRRNEYAMSVAGTSPCFASTLARRCARPMVVSTSS